MISMICAAGAVGEADHQKGIGHWLFCCCDAFAAAQRQRIVIDAVCGPRSVLPYGAESWSPGPRPSRLLRIARNASPMLYPVALLAIGVVIANAAPPFVTPPLPMSPVVVSAPTVLEHTLELRRDTLVRMLTLKHVDSATA